MPSYTEPLEATVVGLNGKYVILDVGSNDNVQTGDVFDDGELLRFTHPTRKNDDGSDLNYEVRGAAVELYVEKVNKDHCLTVITFAERIPYFDHNLVKQGKYTVTRGHPHRVTGSANILNSGRMDK